MLDANSNTFHIDLRRARERCGLTQEEFAERVGLGEKSQQKYESPPDRKHATRPRTKNLQLINAFLLSELGEAFNTESMGEALTA